jgi:hypothetical protein
MPNAPYSEKLASCQRLRLGVETLRQWMIADDLWIDRRHRLASPHQPRRRRECLGELVQIDGSAEAKRVSAHQLETPINRPGRDGAANAAQAPVPNLFRR